METCNKMLVFLVVLQLLFLLQVTNVRASESPIYAAVWDGPNPGIWCMQDDNDDGDALDPGETSQFLGRSHFTDVAVDENGILYAIDGMTGMVYRMEDLNDDGDGEDPGEVTTFRDSTGVGIDFTKPLSIAATSYFDPDTTNTYTLLYLMDLSLQRTYRLQDLNGDKDAQDAAEIVFVQESTSLAPFAPIRMTTDEVGRIVGTNPNTLSVVRLDDINGDGAILIPREQPCPASSCGPAYFQEYHIIRQYVSTQSINLHDPFGVSVSRNSAHTSLVCFVSEGYSREKTVLKLTDLDGDDDALDSGETTVWCTLQGIIQSYDLTCDPEDNCYVATESYAGISVTAMHDHNNDGDADDFGEDWLYADFSGIGIPLGLAIQPPQSRPLSIKAELVDSSPMKGPLLVVEDGNTEVLTLRVTYQDTGDPAGSVTVGHSVVAGCLDLCPHSYRTDASGIIKYDVTRTAPSPEGGELLKFWAFGDEEFVPVVATPCTPIPVAIPGPDQVVFASQSVLLDGSASIGAGLHYCWDQTGGPDVGLPECTEATISDPTVAFTAPAAPATLTFDLYVRNACDYEDVSEVTVEVVGAFTLGLATSYDTGILSLDFHIGTSASATWLNYLILTYPSVQVIPLWTAPLSVVHPPIDIPISFPFPGVGWIGIWTALYTVDGPQAVELVWDDTGW